MTEFSEVRYARSSGDIDIAYQTAGSGPIDLVFVSGFTSHLDLSWTMPFFNWILSWDGTARIIVFDKRGTGLSDRSLGFGSLAERADDIRAVMDACGVERAALCGASEGGPLSMVFAATYPDRVSHLILYGCFPRFVRGPDYPHGPTKEMLQPMFDAIAPTWGKGDSMRIFIQDIPYDEEVVASIARFERSACTPNMMREIMQRNMEIDVCSILSALSVPTLVLHNASDPAVVVEHGRYLAEHIPGAKYVEGTGNCHGSWDPTKMAWVGDAVIDFLGGQRAEPVGADRVLATVLFTDIVGSTAHTASVGDHGWRELLDRHDEIARMQIDKCQGRLVKTTGDGILATFDGPGRAITCAQQMAKEADRIGLELRAGVHTGEIERRGDDITGLGVVIARRICDIAPDGELLASRTVKELVIGSGTVFTEHGTHSLKGVPDEWQLFAVA